MGALSELAIELDEIKTLLASVVYEKQKAERENIACDICDKLNHMVNEFFSPRVLYYVPLDASSHTIGEQDNG